MSDECIVYWCHDEAKSRGHCHSHYYHTYQKGDDNRLASIRECDSCGEEYRYDPGSNRRRCNSCRFGSCEWCGEWLRVPSGSKGRFCSAECHNDSMRNWFTCENCGEETYGRKRTHDGEQFHKRRFCDRECFQEHASNGGLSLDPVPEKKETCRSCRMQFVVAWAGSERFCSDVCQARWEWRDCPHCGERYHAPKGASYCSSRCEWRDNKEGYNRERRERYSRQRNNCELCGQFFHGRGKYCPHGCRDKARRMRRREAKDRRRARLKEATVEEFGRIEIYQRDNWQCQICGDKVDVDADPEGTDYPSLDHIVPISQGGEHSRRNVQLTHRSCNTDKADGAVGSQLLLIG